MINTIAKLRCFLWAVLAAAGACLAFDHCAAAKEPEQSLVQRGIVAEPTAGVRSVKVAGGYMVPYVEKIPNTDVTFEMIPVPGGEFLMGGPPGEADRNEDEGP